MDFTNFKSLLNHIEEKVELGIPEVGEMVRNLVEEYIHLNLYLDNEEHEYVRTWEYLKSISVSEVKKIRGQYQVEIYFDTDKISPNFTNVRFNQHTDVYGNPTNEVLPLWLEYGTEDKNGNFYPREGIEGIHNVQKVLAENREHVTKLMKYLSSKGFNCTLRN